MVVEGTVVKLAIPAVFKDVLRAKLVPETEDTVRAGFGGIKVVLGTFEGSELFDRKVFRELFDREAGKIVRHSILFPSADCPSFILFVPVANCSSIKDW